MELLNFYEFIYDRQLIWTKKEVFKLKFPWTTDEILRNYKFCCAYREQDKCTKYLIAKIIENPILSINAKIFNIILFRRFNIYGLFDGIFEEIENPETFKMKYWEQHLDECKKEGYKLFNDAYALSQKPFNKDYRYADKHIQILMSMEEIAQSIPDIAKYINEDCSLEDICNMLMMFNGIGPFLAHQIMVDLTYIPNLIKRDINSYVQVGPGAKPTVDMLFPMANKKTDKDYTSLCRWLFEHQQHQFELLAKQTGKQWLDIYYKDAYYKSPYLSLANIQSCCCEARKYYNLQHNPRARKRYYKGDKNGLS